MGEPGFTDDAGKLPTYPFAADRPATVTCENIVCVFTEFAKCKPLLCLAHSNEPQQFNCSYSKGDCSARPCGLWLAFNETFSDYPL